MNIKNVKGSSKVSPKAPAGYKSWRDYWEQNKHQIFDDSKDYQCPGCGKWFPPKNFDGCHVQKDRATDKKW